MALAQLNALGDLLRLHFQLRSWAPAHGRMRKRLVKAQALGAHLTNYDKTDRSCSCRSLSEWIKPLQTQNGCGATRFKAEASIPLFLNEQVAPRKPDVTTVLDDNVVWPDRCDGPSPDAASTRGHHIAPLREKRSCSAPSGQQKSAY